MNRFSRSWEMTKVSFRVIGQDKELLLFPLISLILSIIFIMGILFPTVIVEFTDDGSVEWDFLKIAVTFVTYLGLAFIGTFSNMCIAYTAKTRFDGGDATFGESVSFTMKRVHLVLAWATVSATVGLLLRGLDEVANRAGAIGEIVIGIIRSLLGMAWAAITLFVIPSMVYRGLGPLPAIKDSIRVLKECWGESLIRSFGFGIMQFAFFMLGIVVFGGLFATVGAMSGTVASVLAVLAIVYFVGVVFVFMLASVIFNTALYHYASTGKVVTGYTQEIMTGAFHNK
jgi:hypothetical protein